ncbi:hypothetical protein YPPY95_4873, partial [Yersinia pestis PY-95]
MLPSLLAK